MPNDETATSKHPKQTAEEPAPSTPVPAALDQERSEKRELAADNSPRPAAGSGWTTYEAWTGSEAAAVSTSAAPIVATSRDLTPGKKRGDQAGESASATPGITSDKASAGAAELPCGKCGETTAATAATISTWDERGSESRTHPTKTAGDTPVTEASSKQKPPTPSQDRTETRPIRAADTSRLYENLDWEYCGLRPVRLGPAALPPEPSEHDQLFLSADTFDYDPELELLWLSGDVRMAQGSRHIGADKIVYDRDSADLVAKGKIYLENPGIRLIANKAQMNLESDKGNLSDVHYRLTGKINARGKANQAELVQPTLTRYRDIVYTTCRPGQSSWSLDAAKLELDQAEGRGVARNAKLRVRGVPVFYTPYLSFPIDDRRKSGILVPTFGNSDNNGIDVTVPYYWNIAPNMDATFFPRYLSKRGPMLGTEFRYLSPRQKAELYGEVLPTDNEREDLGARWGYRFEQTGSLGSRWSSSVNYNAVSDEEYLEDFGNRLDLTSTRNIERRGDLTYWSEDYSWHLLTRLQDYQTLDAALPPEFYPYARLPQLLFAMSPYQLDSGIELEVGAEYNYFAHDARVFGHRASLQSYASWPFRKSYGHLIPQLSLYTAGYDLQDQEPDKSTRPSYAIPSFNLDAELVFERTIKWFEQDALQTLEPRVFYLYTPFADQDDIPVFDSSELSFSYYSLFRPNRFSGSDRIGDANQLAVGLTSRTLGQRSGVELLRASFGQILYFRDRDVQLVGSPETNSNSSIAGELSARILRNWTGRASFEYDPSQETDRSRKRVLELHYQTANNRLLNLTYRFDLGTSEATRYEDTDLSFRLPLSPQLQLVGRWNYSLLNSQTVEAFAGLEYGQCCWRMRLVGRHLKNKPDSAGTSSFMVQFELAGLGSIGQQVDKLFERGIYGYHPY